MRQIKSENIRLASGAAAVLSVAEITPTEYEVMLASPDFSVEYEVRHADCEYWALARYENLRERFHVPAPTGKYAKLADDLRQAAAVGYAAAAQSGDGGTCNFDAVTLRLPRWARPQVEAAAKAAGVGCWVWNLWGTKSFVFPIAAGQADARTAAAEAMRDHLRDAGYDAGVYYAID